MNNDPLSDWHPESYRDQSGKMRQKIEYVEALAAELHAVWDEFNKTQRIGRPRRGTYRNNLIALTEALAIELPFLEQRLDSDSLESTNDYLIVLTARQELNYSRDRLGMV